MLTFVCLIALAVGADPGEDTTTIFVKRNLPPAGTRDEYHFEDVAFSPDGATLAASVSRNYEQIEIRTYDLKAAGRAPQIASVAAYPNHFIGVGAQRPLFADPRKPFVVLPWDRSHPQDVVVVDPFSREQLGTFANASGLAPMDATLSPDGRLLAIACADTDTTMRGAVGVWNLQSRKVIFNATRVDGYYGAVAFSADSKMIAVGGGQRGIVSPGRGDVSLWKVATGELLFKHADHDYGVESIVFSNAEQRPAVISAGGMEGEIEVKWRSVPNGEQVANLKATRQFVVGAMDLSPDGRWLAMGLVFWGNRSGGRAAQLEVWDLKQQKLIATLLRGDDPITSVKFSPDGTMLASNGNHGTLNLWEVRSVSKGEAAALRAVTGGDDSDVAPDTKPPHGVPQTPGSLLFGLGALAVYGVVIVVALLIAYRIAFRRPKPTIFVP